jgi:hypothetical protein
MSTNRKEVTEQKVWSQQGGVPKGDIKHIPLPDNSVDFIISNCVISDGVN